MAENSSIEWTDHTFNPWRGCQKVSPGCANCYAETLSNRWGGTLGEWGPPHATDRVIAAESYWRLPVKWNRQAEAAGERKRVFCASLADVFEDAPQVVTARERLWDLIDDTPWLDWLLLTKRPQNVQDMAPDYWLQNGFPANVWLGTSVEDQERADERIPALLDIPARVSFLSCEPLLGPVDLVNMAAEPFHHGLNWVIVGGESGPGARPMHPLWARDLRDQCVAFGVAFLFKQWGAWAPLAASPDGTQRVGHGDVVWTGGPALEASRRVGKHAAGRLLDGRTWDEVPQVVVPA